jgi:hypothetical protein
VQARDVCRNPAESVQPVDRNPDSSWKFLMPDGKHLIDRDAHCDRIVIGTDGFGATAPGVAPALPDGNGE